MPVIGDHDTVKVRRLYTELRRRIMSGALPRGHALPSQRELSQEAGVAEGTASEALARLARDGLIRRVPRRGSFVCEEPSPAATIDFVHMSSPPGRPQSVANLEYVNHFVALCDARGWRAVWQPLPYGSYDRPETMVERFRKSRGVIALGSPDAFVRTLHDAAIPVVSFVSPPEPHIITAPYPRLERDRGAVIDIAVRHLIELGRRRIIYASHGSRYWTEGFIASARRHELTIPLDWIVESKGDYFMRDVNPKIRRLLAAESRPQAICCPSDHDAQLMLQCVLDAGLRVPEDVAIVATASSPEALTGPVPLTTVGMNVEEICRRALDLIEEVEPGFNPGERPLFEPEYVPLYLTVNASTSPAHAGQVTRFEVIPEKESEGQIIYRSASTIEDQCHGQRVHA